MNLKTEQGRKSAIEERIKFLKNRIDRLDECITMLEITAKHFYSQEGKETKGWNVMLGSRDKIQKLIDEDYKEIQKQNP